MSQTALLIAVSRGATREIARRAPAASGLEMRALDRSLAELAPWSRQALAGAEVAAGEAVWLVLDDTAADLGAALVDGLDGESSAARLLGAGRRAQVAASSAELSAAFSDGFAPLPALAMRLDALSAITPAGASSGEPDPSALAAMLASSGAAVRLVPVEGSAGADAFLRAALTVRRTLGHVPAACLVAIARASGGGLGDIRRAHAALNGDAAARRSIEAAGAQESYRAIGCASLRPIRRQESAEPEPGRRIVETELGRWSLDARWATSQISRARETLAGLSALRTSDDCVIVGNGPSLRAVDPELFRRNDVIVSNFAALSPLLAETARIFTVTNGLVAEQGAAAFNLSGIPVKLAPLWLAENLREEAGFRFVNAVGEPAFLAEDPAGRISWAATVSFFNMQVAYHLGYRRALLVGFDHSYAQNEKAEEGAVLEEANADPNHFDALYFAGKRWQKANLDLMQQVYLLAREAFEADGREILNLSPQSKLAIFPRVDVAEILAERREAGGLPLRSAAPRRLIDAPQAEADRPRASESPADASIGEVELSDVSEGGSYAHLNFGFRNVRAGERVWSYFFLKLQQIDGRAFLEIRRNDIMPVSLVVWPATHSSDEWGDFLRVAVGLGEPAETPKLRSFLDGLTPGDRRAVGFLLGEAGGRMRGAIAAKGVAPERWEPHIAAVEVLIAAAGKR